MINSDSNSIKRILGIIATKDGGCLVNGISVRYTTEEDSGQFKGFLLKYNPQWHKASIPEILNKVEITIYPNPCSQTLHIDNTQTEIKDISIYDVMGREIKKYSINTTKSTLDVSNLQSGMYFLKITTEHGILTRKVQAIR